MAEKEDGIEIIHCPNCASAMIIKNLKFCEECGVSWFILKCVKYKKDKNGKWVK